MRRIVLSAAIALALATLSPAAADAAEICGDALDNDSDLMADEGCNPAAVTGVDENPLDPRLTGTVAPVSGNVTYVLPPDIEVTTAYGPSPLVFQRRYISLFEPTSPVPSYRKALGAHWQHNFMSWIDFKSAPNPDQALVHLVDGRDLLFQKTSTSGGWDWYTGQEGSHVDYLRQKTNGTKQWELRTLTGEVYVYNWSSPIGKLIEIRDSLATANKLTLTYNGSGLLDKVTDATGKKQLVFSYTSDLLTEVLMQTVDGGTPTTRIDVDFVYTSSNPTTMTIGGVNRQSMTYSGGYLTLIEDADGTDIVAFGYLSSTPGKVVRSTSEVGDLGFEYGSSRASCSGGSIVYFNRIGTTACDDDADCGSDYLCGGETNFAGTNTGVCYRAARCLQLTSPDEDLIDTVTALPTGGGCTAPAPVPSTPSTTG
jgi:hypothetical protein